MNRSKRIFYNQFNKNRIRRIGYKMNPYINESFLDDSEDYDFDYNEDDDDTEYLVDVDSDNTDNDTEYIIDTGENNDVDYSVVEPLKDRIMKAVKKLNSIRREMLKYDKYYSLKPLNPNVVPIKTRELNELNNKIQNEGRMLDIYKQEQEEKREQEERVNIDDMEPNIEDLESTSNYDFSDEEIFDEPEEEIFDETEENIAQDNYSDSHTEEEEFINAMNRQLNDRSEDEREAFYLVRKSQPDIDYYVTVLTNFNNNSFYFNVLKVDEEDCENSKIIKIPLSDIDFDNTDISEL